MQEASGKTVALDTIVSARSIRPHSFTARQFGINRDSEWPEILYADSAPPEILMDLSLKASPIPALRDVVHGGELFEPVI